MVTASVTAIFSRARGGCAARAPTHRATARRSVIYGDGSGKLRKELGWAPTVQFGEGFKGALAWYRAEGWLKRA